MKTPQCTILAGPNGSGKSSIYKKFNPPGEFVNADDIAIGLRSSNVIGLGGYHVQAGRIAIKRVNDLIASGADFTFETTLSSQHSLGVMRKAVEAGFQVGLLYVVLDSPFRSIDRVHFRVRDGGHDIPDDDITRRYDASLRNLPVALKLAHQSVIIDNSPEVPLFLFEKGEELLIRDFDHNIALHRRLIKIVHDAFIDELENNKRGR